MSAPFPDITAALPPAQAAHAQATTAIISPPGDNVLLPLEQLPHGASLSHIEATLRTIASACKGADQLEVVRVRSQLISQLERLGVKSPARWVDAALPGTTDRPSDSPAGAALQLSSPEPWPEPVDGRALIADLALTFRRYIALPDLAEVPLALWVLFSHSIDNFFVAPILAILSPQKRCGKTTLLTLIKALTPRALASSNISAAAIFRSIEALAPTLVIDEADSFLKFSEEIRGILNAGHTHANAYVVRITGEDLTPRQFSVWCPKAIAAIGRLPDTLEDRSIVVHLKRRAPDEHVERLRLDRSEDFNRLCRQAARWANDNAIRLAALDPDVPSLGSDRAMDNWRPLLAIAQAIGSDCFNRATSAALAFNGKSESQEDSVAEMLLEDLRDLFEREKARVLPSATIVAELVEMEDRPWPEWKGGSPLTTRQLARLLRPFGISPKTSRLGSTTPKCYERADFVDAWHRYPKPKLVGDPQHEPQASAATPCAADVSTTVPDGNPQPSKTGAGPPAPVSDGFASKPGHVSALPAAMCPRINHVADVADRTPRAP
jgi:Protein of unknown function (DUF3631)